MTITIEMIDELRKRANVSFESAKEALERCNGDLVEALIYLEKQNKIKSESTDRKESFVDKVKVLIRKANNTRFIISKNGRTVANVSLTVAIVIGTVTFHVSAIALMIVLLTGHRLKFEKNNGEDMQVNEVLDKVHDNIDNFRKKFNDDIEK